VQGGVSPDLRRASAAATAALDFPGFGIGGLSVGEPASERNLALEATMTELPTERPRYLMGVGDPQGMLDAIARGVDMFDCVWPTRLARHGKVLGRRGDYNLRSAPFATDERPLDPDCECSVCGRYTRSYLRHLLRVREMSSQRLISIHNLAYVTGLMSAARQAIVAGDFSGFCRRFAELRVSGDAPGPLI